MNDIAIIGAGPAGLTLGCYLAYADIPCVIIERAHHPRPHVGESLMPAAIRVLREIGFLPIMETGEFPRSGGVVYHTPGGEAIDIAYSEFPQAGVDQGYTYHVDRSKFDMLLLKHAESLGCRILQGVAAREVSFDPSGRATGVHVSMVDHDVLIRADLVVDAAGRATKVGRQLGLRRDHPELDKFALHAWFVGVDRGPPSTERFTHVYFIPQLRGWAWQAPIDDEITSLGLVAERALYQDSGRQPERFFEEALGRSAALANATRRATRVNDLKGEANYSYELDEVCGDGWLAVGDAARFIDPVFSSGVSTAMHGARYAAELIRGAYAASDFSRERLLPYEEKLRADASVWDEFIRLFYRLPRSFAHALESAEHRSSVLRLIQGEVDSVADASVLREARSLIQAVEDAADHPLRGELIDAPPGGLPSAE